MTAQLVDTIRTTVQPNDHPYMKGAWRPTYNEWNAVFANGEVEVIGTIPTESEAEQARVARMQQMGPEKIAPLVAYLLGDAAHDVTGQIFAVRMNEIFLMSQSRPLRSVHRGEGWSAQSIAAHGMPALKPSFYQLDRSADIFSWDAI